MEAAMLNTVKRLNIEKMIDEILDVDIPGILEDKREEK